MAEKSKYKIDKQEEPKEPRPGGKRKRKVYPPHWEIRQFGRDEKTGLPMMSVFSKSIPWYSIMDVILKKRGNLFILRSWVGLKEELEDFAIAIPETRDWPVRFLNGQPIECGREVIE